MGFSGLRGVTASTVRPDAFIFQSKGAKFVWVRGRWAFDAWRPRSTARPRTCLAAKYRPQTFKNARVDVNETEPAERCKLHQISIVFAVIWWNPVADCSARFQVCLSLRCSILEAISEVTSPARCEKQAASQSGDQRKFWQSYPVKGLTRSDSVWPKRNIDSQMVRNLEKGGASKKRGHVLSCVHDMSIHIIRCFGITPFKHIPLVKDRADYEPRFSMIFIQTVPHQILSLKPKNLTCQKTKPNCANRIQKRSLFFLQIWHFFRFFTCLKKTDFCSCSFPDNLRSDVRLQMQHCKMVLSTRY